MLRCADEQRNSANAREKIAERISIKQYDDDVEFRNRPATWARALIIMMLARSHAYIFFLRFTAEKEQ